MKKLDIVKKIVIVLEICFLLTILVSIFFPYYSLQGLKFGFVLLSSERNALFVPLCTSVILAAAILALSILRVFSKKSLQSNRFLFLAIKLSIVLLVCGCVIFSKTDFELTVTMETHIPEHIIESSLPFPPWNQTIYIPESTVTYSELITSDKHVGCYLNLIFSALCFGFLLLETACILIQAFARRKNNDTDTHTLP